jgi:hypothetical protein
MSKAGIPVGRAYHSSRLPQNFRASNAVKFSKQLNDLMLTDFRAMQVIAPAFSSMDENAVGQGHQLIIARWLATGSSTTQLLLRSMDNWLMKSSQKKFSLPLTVSSM